MIKTRWRPLVAALCLILLPSCFLLTLQPGCSALGVAANALPRHVKPKYAGLQGQSVGVMVWADQGLLIDWPSLQLDLANAVQKKLSESKAKELEKTSYPVKPASIVRYQRDHPGIEALPIAETAPRLGVSRLIYVEVQDLRTRPELSLEMFRGSALAGIRVVEVAGGQGTVAYTETDLRVLFPKKANEVGVPGIGDYRTYLGTIDALSTEIAHRFMTYEEED